MCLASQYGIPFIYASYYQMTVRFDVRVAVSPTDTLCFSLRMTMERNEERLNDINHVS